MSFVDQDRSREKLVSGVASIALVGVVGYVLATGLAINVIREAGKQVILHEWKTDAPPPPPPPIQRTIKKTPDAHPPIFAPTPIVPPLPQMPRTIDTTTIVPPPDTLTRTIDPTPPPPPPAPSQAKGVTPTGNPGAWVSTEDYPPAALRTGLQGRTSFRLEVGVDGRPTACTVTGSSGSAELDRTACRILIHRAKFNAALDAGGKPVASSYASSVLWQIPQN